MLACLVACVLVIGGSMATANAHEECTPSQEKLRAQRRAQIVAADKAYDAAVAAADANWRAATWGKRKQCVPLKEKLAALRATRATRSATLESAATARRAAYAAADALYTPEPTTAEEHYLAIVRETGAKIETAYLKDLQSAYACAGAAERKATLAAATQLRAERYNALRALYLDHRPQNRW